MDWTTELRKIIEKYKINAPHCQNAQQLHQENKNQSQTSQSQGSHTQCSTTGQHNIQQSIGSNLTASQAALSTNRLVEASVEKEVEEEKETDAQ